MICLFGRGFESHQLHEKKQEKSFFDFSCFFDFRKNIRKRRPPCSSLLVVGRHKPNSTLTFSVLIISSKPAINKQVNELTSKFVFFFKRFKGE